MTSSNFQMIFTYCRLNILNLQKVKIYFFSSHFHFKVNESIFYVIVTCANINITYCSHIAEITFFKTFLILNFYFYMMQIWNKKCKTINFYINTKINTWNFSDLYTNIHFSVKQSGGKGRELGKIFKWGNTSQNV